MTKATGYDKGSTHYDEGTGWPQGAPDRPAPEPAPESPQPPAHPGPQVRPARTRRDAQPPGPPPRPAADFPPPPGPSVPGLGTPPRRRGLLGRPNPNRHQPSSANGPHPGPPPPPVPGPPPGAPAGPQAGPQAGSQPVPPPGPPPATSQSVPPPRPAVPATHQQDTTDYAPWQTPLSPPPAPEQVPKEGWRAALYGISGRRLNFGLSANERRIEAWLRSIDTPVTNHCVATMNVKGGAGKTTTTIAMGTAFAMHRRDQCIGIDANPDRGNLAQRLGQEHLYTIRDLLDNLDEITGAHTLRKFTNQASSRFEVIASDRDPVKARAFTPHEYRTVQQVVRAFRQVILTDTGIDLTNPVVDAILQSTDTLVIAASTAQDVAGLAWETLNTVEQRGFDHLVQRAVVSIVKEPSGDQVPLAELRSAFQDRCRAVVVIPNDRSLVGGGNFNWQALSGATRRAYLELAARVAEDFNTSRPW